MTIEPVKQAGWLSSQLRGQSLPRFMSLAVDLEGLRRTVSRIEARWPDHKARDEKDREALVQAMEKHRSSGDWSGCQLSLVCAAAQALFDGERRARIDLAKLRQFYIDECSISDRGPLLTALLNAYMDSFSPSAEHTAQLGRALTAARSRLPWRAAQLLESIPEILDPKKAVAAIVREMTRTPHPYEHLVSLGLRQPHAPGLMDHAHINFIEKLGDELDRKERADQLLAWLQPKGKSIRSSGAAEALTALLHPWVDKDPDGQRQSDLTHRLVDMYGDPRRSSGDPWFRVGAAERAVFLRWLTGENLRLLFDAITDTNDSHMWSARREFYLGLHRQKRIDAVWVAFAPSGAREARRILEKTGHGKGLDFGKQVARGSRANTSLLIAKIGRKIVVDGSHSYKVHIFDEDDTQAPKLYLPIYNCEKIRLRTPERQKKTHNGDWQNWVLMRI